MEKYQLQEIEQSIKEHQKNIQFDGKFSFQLADDKENVIDGSLNTWLGEQLIIELPLDVLAFEVGGNYTAHFNTSDCIYVANVTILNKIKKEKVFFYVAKIASPIHRKQKRNYFRLEAQIPVQLKQTAQNKTVPVTSVDISAGGLKVTSNQVIEENIIVDVKFELHNKNFEIQGKILTSFEEVRQIPYVYRISFVNLTHEARDQLLSEVVAYQRELLAIERFAQMEAKRKEAENNKTAQKSSTTSSATSSKRTKTKTKRRW